MPRDRRARTYYAAEYPYGFPGVVPFGRFERRVYVFRSLSDREAWVKDGNRGLVLGGRGMREKLPAMKLTASERREARMQGFAAESLSPLKEESTSAKSLPNF